MAIYPNSVINALSTTADVLGYLNRGRVELLTLLDLQWKNQFEIIFVPQVFNTDTIPNMAIDTAITSLHVQNISGIKLPDIEVIDINGIKHVTGITSPEDVTMEFIENDLGLVRFFLQRWMNLIYTPMVNYDPVKDGIQKAAGGGFNVNDNVNTEGHSSYYVFRDNQKAAKKDAVIMFKGTTSLPSAGGWMKLDGLKLKSVSGFDIGQKEEEPLMITATMSVDMIKFIVPLTMNF